MAKVRVARHSTSEGEYIYTRAWFICPGCKQAHGYVIENGPNQHGPLWQWNGDVDKPTFTPSLLTWAGKEGATPYWRCHFFVTDGVIRFCGDCIDDSAPAPWNGQIIPLPDLDPEHWMSKLTS